MPTGQRKTRSRHGQGVLLLLLWPIVSGDEDGDTVDGGGGGRAKGEFADPPDLGGDNNTATKEKSHSSGTDETSSFSSSSPCLMRRNQWHLWWRRRRTSQRKICRPPRTWEVPTTRQHRRNRRHPIYIFSRWSLCGRARLAVGLQTRPLYWFCTWTWPTFPWEKYFPSLLDRAAAAPHPFHPSSLCHLKLCVWWSYFNFIDMMINDSNWSTLLSDLTQLLLLFITKYPNIKNICQVINYTWIKTIKREQTFCKLSIRNQSILSKKNKLLASNHF